MFRSTDFWLNLRLLSLSVTMTACNVPRGDLQDDRTRVRTNLSTESAQALWGSDFPAESDLAILLGTLGAPVISADDRDVYGNALLPETWLNQVSAAFYPTEVEDALERENIYSEWRAVSIRVTPCGPIGITPDNIDALCWPAVRVVWQPIMLDFRLEWGVLAEAYADDRAIHAIYPLRPRDRDGQVTSTATRDAVTAHLTGGGSAYGMSSSLLSTFAAERDQTANWLLNEVAFLRDTRLETGSWSGFDMRPELQGDEDTEARFTERLAAFLSVTARNENLGEMTAFSLPEGRNPAGSDIWVFVGFDGNDGRPTQKELTVVGRDSGRELVNIGLSQSIAVGVEDPTVQAEIDAGNTELADSLIISEQDILDMTDAMSDPYEFLVPNTSCASCHRLNNELRFNLHALSGFLTDEIFVSPRVEGDVQRDLGWTSRLR